MTNIKVVIPPVNKVTGGVTLVSPLPLALSVRPSICLSVEKWSLQDCLLTYNDDTSYICWPQPEKHLYWFGSQTVRSVQIRTLKIVPFLQKLHFLLRYFTHVLTMIRGAHLLIYRSKGQRSRSDWDLKHCTISARLLHFLLTYNVDTSHVLTMTGGAPLLSPRNALRRGYSNAAVVPCVRQSVSPCVMPYPCEHDSDLFVAHIFIKLGRHVHYDERMNPIDFGGQRSRSQLTHIETSLWTRYRLNHCVLLHQTWQTC